jgi:hypothetical protein
MNTNKIYNKLANLKGLNSIFNLYWPAPRRPAYINYVYGIDAYPSYPTSSRLTAWLTSRPWLTEGNTTRILAHSELDHTTAVNRPIL